MSLVTVEQIFGAVGVTAAYPSGYTAGALNLGPLMYQNSDTPSGNESVYAGPTPVNFARPLETSSAKAAIMPFAISWSPTIDWVFFADGTAAGASPRNLSMFLFNKATHTFTFQGYITLAYPQAATNFTHIANLMTYDKYTVGTANCSGATAAVSGSGTAWSTSRLAVGSRIAFGTSDPTTNPTWYEIASITGDTALTLTTVGPNTGGTGPYVIEELRAIQVVTNNTTANGGVYVAKGLRPELFGSGGTAIAAATSTDNIRAVYWLADAATVTNITSKGAGIEPRVDWNTHYLWTLEGLASPNEILFKYNLRAALTLTSGKDGTPFNSFVFKTGAGGAYTGTLSAINAMRFATMASGPGSGIGCLYFVTTTRIYRTVATSTILTGSTTWLSGGDAMVEIPPGGVASFAATSALNSLEYVAAIDKLIIMTTSTTAFKSYVTGYNALSNPMDRIFTNDFRQLLQVAADSSLAPLLNTLSTSGIAVWEEGGMCYFAIPGTTATTNFIYAVPLGADWEYASTSNSVIITPSMATPNCSSYDRVYVNEVGILGGRSGTNLGACTEPFRVSYRTSGISDNSGSWTLLDYSGNLSGASAASSIQFKIEFRCIGHTNLPARIISLACVYNDTATDTHFQMSVGLSSISASKFAWRFSTAFGGTVPTLYVRLYDATNPNTLYLLDNSASPTGTWEVSTNGGSTWASWASADKGNETTYLRYTPASLGSGINVRAVLSLA